MKRLSCLKPRIIRANKQAYMNGLFDLFIYFSLFSRNIQTWMSMMSIVYFIGLTIRTYGNAAALNIWFALNNKIINNECDLLLYRKYFRKHLFKVTVLTMLIRHTKQTTHLCCSVNVWRAPQLLWLMV